MDAYAPLIQTAPQAWIHDVGEGWRSPPVTSTYRYVEREVRKQSAAVSSKDGGTSRSSFVLLHLPILNGLERLRAFQNFRENWNAEGGLPPAASAIEVASKVFGLVSSYSVPQVTLSSGGEPMLIFGGDKRGEIVVSRTGAIGYFFTDENAPFGDEIEFTDQLPGELIEYLSA